MSTNTNGDSVFTFLDGKSFTLDGVHGQFRHEVRWAVYPYAHATERLYHEPSAKGRRSEAYQALRREYRDDWVTDLTDSIERYCEIATKLGYR